VLAQAERKRILSAGGFIRNGRVIGVLEPTRTIGDLEEKARTRPGVISAVPDSRVVRIGDGDVLAPHELDAAVDALATTAAGGSGSGVVGGTATVARLNTIPPHQRGGVPSPLAGGAGSGSPSSIARALSAGSAGRLPLRITAPAIGSGLGVGAAGHGSITPDPRGTAASFHSPSRATTPLAAAAGGPHGAPSSIFGGAGVVRPARAPAYTLSLAEAVTTSGRLPVSLVIVASDGVWDVMPTPSAVAVAVHALAFYRDPALAAAEVVAMAQRLGSADDITCSIAWLMAPEHGPRPALADVLAAPAVPLAAVSPPAGDAPVADTTAPVKATPTDRVSTPSTITSTR